MKVLKKGLIILLCWIIASPMFASNAVRDLKQQVKQSRVQLELTRRKWHEAEQALRQLETKLAVSARALAKTNDSIYRNRRAIRAKKHDLATNKKQVAKRIGELAKSLRGIDQWLNEPALKWVLSSNDPGDWSRLATYHRIIGHSQQQRITELNRLQQRIVQDEAILEKLAASLKQERAKRKQRLASLRALKLDREKLVVRLQVSVHQKTRQLRKDENQLQSMLANLRRSMGRFNGHFEKLRGRLMWPIQGQLEKLFNRSIQGSELRWKGVLFAAPEDRSVRAVASGRVVYADWMAGYGWLVIIEHDDGYMTLYGRNHYLYKKAGQKVRKGELIARSGKSGGFSRPALYFSLRHNAEPLDPSQWLRHKRINGDRHV